MSSFPESTARRSRLDQFVRRYYAPLVSFLETPRMSMTWCSKCSCASRSTPHADAIENPEAYIFQAAANVLTDRVRRNGVRRRYFDDTGNEESVEWSSDVLPERVLQGSQSVAKLAAALRTLVRRSGLLPVLSASRGA